MASVTITNKTTSSLSTAFGFLGPLQTKNFSGLSTAAFSAQLAALNTLVTAGTINYCTVVDGTGLNQGADVQNVFGSLGIGALPSSGSAFAVGGNLEVVQLNGTERGFLMSTPGDQGGIVDALWSYGRPIVAGVGLQEIRWLYSDASTTEHIVAALESQGTFAVIGNHDYRARYECYDFDGQENPTFRLTTYPSMTFEMAPLPKEAAIGAMTRSGSTVTVHIDNHNYEVGQSMSLTCGDANYPTGLNLYTIASVPDANHFTFACAGTTAASTAVGQFSTEATMKLRMAGNRHMQLVIGPYSSEAVGIEWYADSMVTASGYGASYGGSILYQPITVTADYAMVAGSTYLCDATAGAIAFSLPAANSYFGKPGRHVAIKKTDASANAVTVTAAGSDKIDGAGTKALASQYKFVVLESDGSANWNIFGSN